MGKEKKRLLVFHPTIAPYRIKMFNDINAAFDADISLYYRNLKSQTFDYVKIEKQFQFKPDYFNKALKICSRVFYFGHVQRIRKFKPDIVMCSEFGSGVWASILYRIVAKKKYSIVTLCDDSKGMSLTRGGLRKLSRDIAALFLDGIILCNEEAEKEYSKISKQTIVFPIIQDEKEYYNDYCAAGAIANKLAEEYDLFGKRVFLFVGRISPEKNIPYLISSFIEQHEIHPENVLFVIGGQNPDYPELIDSIKNRICKSNAEDYIKLVGRKEGTELKSWYYLGQVLILPSTQEAFGAVVNEALLSGEYVMVSSAAGASCLVNEQNGEILNVNRSTISFERSVELIRPLMPPIQRRANAMPYSYDSRMKKLINWLSEI